MADQLRPSPEVFGKRLRALRKAAGLTQEQLSERSGVHRTYIGALENGKRGAGLGTILKLAAALDANPAQLVDGLLPDPPPDRPH